MEVTFQLSAGGLSEWGPRHAGLGNAIAGSSWVSASCMEQDGGSARVGYQGGQDFSWGPALHKQPSVEGTPIPTLSENAGQEIRLLSPVSNLLSCLLWLPGALPIKSKLNA